jgi:hypothetical protein
MVYAAGDEAMMNDVEGYPDAIALDHGRLWTFSSGPQFHVLA